MKITLQQAADDWQFHRKAQGIAANTIRTEQQIVRRFITINGNILVGNVTYRHVDAHLTAAGKTRSRNSLVLDHGALRRFFGWCVATNKAPQKFNPMGVSRPPRREKKERRRLPVAQFGQLLDAAPTGRDRATIALGLYLFLRGGEITSLRIGDLNLQEREVLVTVHKTGQQDLMPVSTELAREMARWLTAYTKDVGTSTLDDSWFLVQGKTQPYWRHDVDQGSYQQVAALIPTKQYRTPAVPVQNALVAIGWMEDTARPYQPGRHGVGSQEGVHTLRRSGARALFDRLRNEGYDGALRTCQAMLHHSSSLQTEHYIGLTLDRWHRNTLIKGEAMYPVGENVVSLSDGTQEDRDSNLRLA